VKQALERGHTVKALLRNDDKLGDLLKNPNLTVKQK
jgi:putative NADH-flavin reductase